MQWWKQQWQPGGWHRQSQSSNGLWRKQANGSWEKNAGGTDRRWPCGDPNCVAALKSTNRKPWLNKHSDAECEICGVHWDKARQKKVESLELVKKKLRAKLSATDNEEEDPTTLEVAVAKEEGTWLGTDDEEAEATTKLSLPQEFVAIAGRLQGPREIPEPPTPAQALAKHRPGKQPPDLSRLEEELAEQVSLLALQKKKVAAGAQEDTQKKIDQLTKQIEGIQNNADGASISATEWELTLKNYNRAETDRLNRVGAATVKAEENADRLEEICAEQIAAWEAHSVVLRAQRAVRDSAWEARRMQLEGHSLEIIEYAETKIKESKARAGNVPMQTSDKDEEAQEEIRKLKHAADAAQKEKADLLARLEALEQKLAVPTTAEGTLSQAAAVLCNRTIMYASAEVPELKTQPDRPYKKRLVLLATNVRQWGQAGRVPIVFRHLLSGAGTEAETQEAFNTMKDVVGAAIWQRMYGDSAVPLDQLVPFQLGNILLEALEKASEKMIEYGKLASYGEQAKTRFAELHAEDQELKKARKAHYGPY